MGSAASKSARRLPTSTQSSLPKLPSQPSQPTQAARTAPSQSRVAEELDETYSRHRDLRGHAPRFQQPHEGAAAGSDRSGGGGLEYGSSTSGASTRARAGEGVIEGGSGKVTGGFSGEKDGAVLRDAQDPQFMANLSRLGQVQIHDAGKFVKAPALAQRTLSARSPSTSSPTQIPPPGHLTAPLLISLLDKLKTISPSQSEVEGVYKQFNMDKDSMEVLRRWVNSPSVGEDEVRVEEGERIVEMKAVWVGPAREEVKRIE